MDENEVKQDGNNNTDTINMMQEKELNIYGLLSFIFSLVGLIILGLPLGIAAVILGIISIVRFEENRQKYKWMGITGLCVGVLDIIGVIINIISAITTLSALF